MLTIFLYTLLVIYLLGLVVNAYLYHTVLVEVWRDDKKYIPRLILAWIFWPVYYLMIWVR